MNRRSPHAIPGLQQLGLLALAVAACSGGDAATGSGLPPGVFARLELEASYPEAFSFLGSVREMPDGTVLAADPLSQVLLRVDLLAGRADTLGQVGDGPQEYRQPDQLFALPGDSTLLVDLGKTQLTVVAPDGSLHFGMGMASAGEDGRMNIVLPRAVDEAGRLYFTGSQGIDQGPSDSTLVLRYDRATQATDTVGWAWRPAPIVTRSGSSVRVMGRQMEGRDDWAVASDGGFAFVRASGYSVEWHHSDGRVVKGPSNAFQARAIGEEDKRAYLERRFSSGIRTMVSMSGSGAAEMSMSRGGGGLPTEAPELGDFEWAREFAPFQPDRSLVSPAGELWVERWLPADLPPQLDVFDGQGVKVGTVDLPGGRQIIGFGTTSAGEPAAYLVRTDEVDLKWLERYRIVR